MWLLVGVSERRDERDWKLKASSRVPIFDELDGEGRAYEG